MARRPSPVVMISYRMPAKLCILVDEYAENTRRSRTEVMTMGLGMFARIVADTEAKLSGGQAEIGGGVWRLEKGDPWRLVSPNSAIDIAEAVDGSPDWLGIAAHIYGVAPGRGAEPEN